MFRLIAAALVAASLSTFSPATAQADTDAARILIVGDSVTQGSRGDYTWRYFWWKNLEARDADVDFVGPTTGVFDNWNWKYTGTDAYADPNFDMDHAAV